jgi:AhpD family alkylhydroperoxidase
MLPAKLRYWLFDMLSVKTMRFVGAVPTRQAKGLTKTVYDMIRDDFFKNGSLTSRSKVPELMAAIWTAGRETMLVEDKVDRTTKDAISALLSQINACPYCEDMLVSLVSAAGKTKAAMTIFERQDLDARDEEELAKALDWVRAIAAPEADIIPTTPFSRDQLPEVFGTMMAMSDINRFSHVVMEDSPVSAPFGLNRIKALLLRMFGQELKVTRRINLEHGRSLPLLPSAELPEDMAWAVSNPRVADALARYSAAVDKSIAGIIPEKVRDTVEASLAAWQGEMMPISRAWLEAELADLNEAERKIARLAIVTAKASYQFDAGLAKEVLGEDRNEERFIRILAWASFSGARRFIQLVSERENALANGKPMPIKSHIQQVA